MNRIMNSDQKLIRLVKENPWIYDQKFRNMYNTEMKEIMWLKLAKVLLKHGITIAGKCIIKSILFIFISMTCIF